jgi:hypothetical protein
MIAEAAEHVFDFGGGESGHILSAREEDKTLMKRTPEGVTVELTEDQYELLVQALGYAAGAAAAANNGSMFRQYLRLANVVNDGNRAWVAYAIEDEESPKPARAGTKPKAPRESR